MLAIESGIVAIAIGSTSLVASIVEIVMEQRDTRKRRKAEEELSNVMMKPPESTKAESKDLIDTRGSGGVEK
jgi:hypothetical protein